VSIVSGNPVTPPTISLPPDVEYPEPGVSWNALKRFTVDEYHAMIAAGVFAEDENFELLEGLLVHKMGKKRQHTLATQRLRQLLESILQGYYVDAQEPVATDDSEPEPDVSIIRGKRDDYLEHQPLARDVLLVIEVAGGSLRQDRLVKKRIYARAGIPVYWIVNLMDRQVEVFTQPTGSAKQPDYANRETIAADGTVVVVLDGQPVGQLAVKDFLP